MAEAQRVAVVTGAAGGIGRAMVRGLMAADMRVAGVDRDREPLEALAASAREQGKADDLLTIQTDLTNDSAVEEITKATRDRFGRIDVLINNAGIGPGAIRPDNLLQRPLKFWEITPDQWRRFVTGGARPEPETPLWVTAGLVIGYPVSSPRTRPARWRRRLLAALTFTSASSASICASTSAATPRAGWHG